jgi:hypothetical protein
MIMFSIFIASILTSGWPDGDLIAFLDQHRQDLAGIGAVTLPAPGDAPAPPMPVPRAGPAAFAGAAPAARSAPGGPWTRS